MKRFITTLLAAILAGSPNTFAQAPPPAEPVQRRTLKVFVLQGNDAVNSIPDRKSTTPVVEVRDDNDNPVEGAEVVFEIPASGAGGRFAEQRFTLRTRTNPQGQATAPFQMNGTPGEFQILVMATVGDRVGRALISQTNSMRPIDQLTPKASSSGQSWYRNWKLLAIASAGASGAAIAFSRRNKTTVAPTVPPTITIIPGGPIFGP